MKTREERRKDLVRTIESLRARPPGVERDLQLRIHVLELELVNSWQVAEHFAYRLERLREFAMGFASREAVEQADADMREERLLPVPSCRKCREPLA